jgi:hypothetical protein
LGYKRAACLGAEFLRIRVQFRILQRAVLSRGQYACSLAHVTLALHFVGKTVAPSDFGVGTACGSWARLGLFDAGCTRRWALPYLGFRIENAVEVADAFRFALTARPIVVARKKTLFGGVRLRTLHRFALTRNAAFAVAVEFGRVVRAHFGEPLLAGTGG